MSTSTKPGLYDALDRLAGNDPVLFRSLCRVALCTALGPQTMRQLAMQPPPQDKLRHAMAWREPLSAERALAALIEDGTHDA